MKKKLFWCILPLTITMMLLLSGCMGKEFSVVFNLNGGELISGSIEQKVQEGSAAVAPVVEKGDAELSWDKEFSNITGNTIVNAVWTEHVFKVTFDPVLEDLEKVTVEVKSGETAEAPEFHAENMEFMGWDQDISNISSDMVVKAIWEEKVLSGEEISKQSKTRVLTVHVHDGAYDSTGSGSGFFIDDQGTLITNYHVIEYADSISVEMADGAKYEVSEIINFSEKYDIAILRVAIKGNDYYSISKTASQGATVYAIGSPLGTMDSTVTNGIISNANRIIGKIPCIQMSAAISHGNSGGPLVNERGEVIGVNSFSMTNGSDLNLAIDINILDDLGENLNFSVNDFTEWWRKEINRSYRPSSADNTKYKHSLINTYQSYTNEKCVLSMDNLFAEDATDYKEGYNSKYPAYMYEYNKEPYDKYIAYLKELGFEYDPEISVEADDGILSTYYSASSDVYMMLLVTSERSSLGVEALIIMPCFK